MSENKDKKEKKPFYSKLWFWAIWIVLCVANIVAAYFIPNKNANIFTALSGWVSGVATVALGIIAIVQNERYEKDNEKYIQEQKELQQSIVNENKKQNEFSIRMLKIQDLQRCRDELNDDIFSLLENSLSLSFGASLVKAHSQVVDKNEVYGVSDFVCFCENVRSKMLNMLIKIRNQNFLVEYSKDLIIEITELSDLIYDLEMNYKARIDDWSYIETKFGDDLEQIKLKEKRVKELARDNLFEFQTIINSLSDINNDNDYCDKLFMGLKIYRDEAYNELAEWFNNTMTKEETENGQDENGN